MVTKSFEVQYILKNTSTVSWTFYTWVYLRKIGVAGVITLEEAIVSLAAGQESGVRKIPKTLDLTTGTYDATVIIYKSSTDRTNDINRLAFGVSNTMPVTEVISAQILDVGIVY